MFRTARGGSFCSKSPRYMCVQGKEPAESSGAPSWTHDPDDKGDERALPSGAPRERRTGVSSTNLSTGMASPLGSRCWHLLGCGKGRDLRGLCAIDDCGMDGSRRPKASEPETWPGPWPFKQAGASLRQDPSPARRDLAQRPTSHRTHVHVHIHASIDSAPLRRPGGGDSARGS